MMIKDTLAKFLGTVISQRAVLNKSGGFFTHCVEERKLVFKAPHCVYQPIVDPDGVIGCSPSSLLSSPLLVLRECLQSSHSQALRDRQFFL